MNAPQLKLINAHYQTSYGQRLNLQRLSNIVGSKGKLHRGRPCMLTCRLLNKRVLFFPNGTVQILGGGITLLLLHQIAIQVLLLLHRYNLTLPPPLLRWKVNNMVFHFDLKTCINFKDCICDKDLSYEPELFPAALISKWHPAHVTLFCSGKGMITGVKSVAESMFILQELVPYIKLKT